MSEQSLFRPSDPATSKQAAASLTPDVVSDIQARVLFLLRMYGDMTDSELVTVYRSVYDLRPGHTTSESTIRTRRSELVDKGKVRANGTIIKDGQTRAMTLWSVA